MRIGYVKGLNILKDEELYKNKCKELNVDRIFADKHNEKTALRDMLKYAMKGDIIIVSDALLLSKNAGEFIEIILDLSRRNICLICKNQNIDTSTAIWQNIISALLSFGNKEVISQRNTRLSEELDAYFELVAQKKMTIEEVCRTLAIGKTTYYRRWRQLYTPVVKERHTDKFDYYEKLVKEGKITVVESCRQMNISVATYYRLRKVHQAQ